MIQPSGKLGIGHYLGAIRHWKKEQDQEDRDCWFAIANLHAITVMQDPVVLKGHTLDLTAFYLACGLDPNKSKIFVQSDVPEHAELAWVMSCITSLGELNRMTQFKDKSRSTKQERVGVGLFCYPSLMAADILLYQTHLVPVGEDQKQHIELTRDLAERFNQTFGEAFVLPEPKISDIGARIMSLGDPYKKMSKSDKDEKNYIALEDAPKVVEKKIMRAVTDSLGNFTYDPENQKGLANLIELYSACHNTGIEETVGKFSGQGYGPFKKALAQDLSELVGGIHERYVKHREKEDELRDILAEGAKKARERAQKTLDRVYQLVGFRV